MKAFLFLLLFASSWCIAQTSDHVKDELKQHQKTADHYNDIGLYGESVGELEKIIEKSRRYNLEELTFSATVQKAEIFRKTQDFDRGIALLESLKGTEKYPLVHVRKLGRLAALYAENGAIDPKTQNDSIMTFTQKGIEIATEFGFKEEEASLRNERGFRQSRQRNFEEALENLNQAAQLFREVGDEENEVGALVNTLDLHVNAGDFEKFDSLYPILVERVENKDWYATRSNLYRIVSAPFNAEGDTISAAKWMSKANANTVSLYQKINSAQMAAFKIIHDTNLYKEDALRKSRDLERESNKTKELYLYIVILALVVLLVVLIFFRERRLKQTLNRTVKDLNILNDKYQMLMVESNHRIKNNLQMIISMLEYTKKGAKNLDPRFVRNISTKIQTISALHKHLYLDVHNGLVDLDAFFSEVTRHYETIGISYTIHQSICPVQIQGERIVYFGLILNEMLVNTLEHGNANGGELFIEVTPHGQDYQFAYWDHSSLPENAKSGVGIKLIEQLVRRIDGKDYELNRNTGKYQFSFKSD